MKYPKAFLSQISATDTTQGSSWGLQISTFLAQINLKVLGKQQFQVSWCHLCKSVKDDCSFLLGAFPPF